MGAYAYDFSPARFRVANLNGQIQENWDMEKYFFFVKKLLSK
nr:calcineurin-like phosphoesterase [Mucilaginibacter sp. X4EP1]